LLGRGAPVATSRSGLGGAPLGLLAERFIPRICMALSPIDDVRGSAAYRNDAALTLLRRVLV
jgi:CO/xanthine dehydrogenase FAD-binding subunit